MDPDDCLEMVGPDEIRIKGHRVGLEDIVGLYRDGYSAAQIAAELPGLPLHKIDAAISYYLAHGAVVDAYVARVVALEERRFREDSLREPPAVVRRLRARKAQRQHVGHG